MGGVKSGSEAVICGAWGKTHLIAIRKTGRLIGAANAETEAGLGIDTK